MSWDTGNFVKVAGALVEVQISIYTIFERILMWVECWYMHSMVDGIKVTLFKGCSNATLDVRNDSRRRFKMLESCKLQCDNWMKSTIQVTQTEKG